MWEYINSRTVIKNCKYNNTYYKHFELFSLIKNKSINNEFQNGIICMIVDRSFFFFFCGSGSVNYATNP